MTCDMYVHHYGDNCPPGETALDLSILKVMLQGTRPDTGRLATTISIAMLEQCCNNSKQCRYNVETRVKTEENFIWCQTIKRTQSACLDQLQDPTHYLFPSKVIGDLSIRNIHFKAFLNSHKPSYEPNTTWENGEL